MHDQQSVACTFVHIVGVQIKIQLHIAGDLVANFYKHRMHYATVCHHQPVIGSNLNFPAPGRGAHGISEVLFCKAVTSTKCDYSSLPLATWVDRSLVRVSLVCPKISSVYLFFSFYFIPIFPSNLHNSCMDHDFSTE